MNLDSALLEWQALLGLHNVLQGEGAKVVYGADTSGAERWIPAALRVKDAATLPQLVRIAATHRVPLYPISTGHNWGYGTALPARSGCVIVDLSGLTKILHFDPELGVVTVEPGVTQGMLADFLDRGGHPYMVPVTGAGPTCSLMGNALERGYGITPHADHFGAVTDIVAVLADGSIYRTALREAAGEELARLFKWGIGPYSAGLFSQSGFGIVTEMTIMLARRPPCVKVCLFSLNADDLLGPAVERIQHALALLPGIVGGINLMNQHRVLAMTAPWPEDGVGPDGLIRPEVIRSLGKQLHIAPWTGFASLYGTTRVVGAAQRELRAVLRGIASRVLFLGADQVQWLHVVAKGLPFAATRRFATSAATLSSSLQLVGGRPNETALPLTYWRMGGPRGFERPLDPSRDGCGLIWYSPLVPMHPRTVRAYVDMVRQQTGRHGLEPLITLTSVSDRLFDSTIPLLFERQDPATARAAQSCFTALMNAGLPLGCYPYRLGVDEMQVHAARQPSSTRIHARIRSLFDPYDILAPGRYS